jgi:HupE / UreJ protein
MPNSMVLLKVYEKHIAGDIQLPLGELQSAIGMSINDNSERLVERLGDSLRIYLLKHIRPKTFDDKPWNVQIGEMKVIETKNNKLTGDYKELVIAFTMTPPKDYDLRNFYFDYDVILRQVASHKILVNIKEDWKQGIVSEDGSPSDGSPPDSTLHQLGIIALDVPSGKIPVFQVSLQQGSFWQGFKSMVELGINHISQGTDHLLFLLALLLPASLLVDKKRWAGFGGNRYSLIRLLKIVTAFTFGHSITLLIGALGWVHLPSQWIEITIAFSILISAIHAIRPIFAGREIYIASGFGLIHGLAFANSLMNLSLDMQQLALSILGFNLGIELMQLFIIIFTFPFLMMLSRSTYYAIFRNIGAVLVGISAIAWMLERITSQGNFVTHFVEKVANQAIWLLFGLIILAVIAYFSKSKPLMS